MFLRIPGVEVVFEFGQHVGLDNVVVQGDLAGGGAGEFLQAA